MVQSWVFSIQWRLVLIQFGGTNFTSPDSTSSSPRCASPSICTNHWSVRNGSITWPLRSPKGCMIGLASRSEEHTSELQSLMRISYAVFCLKKKKKNKHNITAREIEYHKTTNT